MNYVFDIDGTICSLTDGDYEDAVPFVERINIINLLFEQGHSITFYTARGMGRFKNDAISARNEFFDLTKRQLSEWGVKYHHLFMGKPAGDIYIDDKGCNDSMWFTSALIIRKNNEIN